MRTYLPFVGATGHGVDVAAQIAEFVALMRDDPEQQRRTVATHPVLMQVAQARADDMASHDYFGHVGRDGNGPDRHVQSAGYTLPPWYPQDRTANSIESIGGGWSNAQDYWAALKRSPGHRMHVLGLHPMYAMQERVGVGWSYMQSSTYRPVWVLLTAP